MQESVCVIGIVLKTAPIGEYDRRITLLTKERGKISAFARGARKPGSKFGGNTLPFCFGTFWLGEGRNYYVLVDTAIQNYFEALRPDYIGACYAGYLAEVADYYTRENNDERDMLGLLYQSLRALTTPSLPNPLIRTIFELKTLSVNGELPPTPPSSFGTLDESTTYTLYYIATTPIEKLYTFTVSDQVLTQLTRIAEVYTRQTWDKPFKSLEILSALEH
jgi:DNA repair protein RecO (recombination protein O)